MAAATQDFEDNGSNAAEDENNILIEEGSSTDASASDDAEESPTAEGRPLLRRALSFSVLVLSIIGVVAFVLVDGRAGSTSSAARGESEAFGLVSLADASVDSSTGLCGMFAPYQDFKEPPVLRSPVQLTLDTLHLCDPGENNRTRQIWYTRAYGAQGIAPSIPGPTILAKPGEKLVIQIHNLLTQPSPNCTETLAHATPADLAFSNNGYCMINGTNLHTHGLHVSPKRGGDDIFEWIKPGEQGSVTVDIPADHMPGTFWYHPHHHHATAEQAGGGAHGAIIIEDSDKTLPPEVQSMPEKLMVLSLVDMRFDIQRYLNGNTPFFGSPSKMEGWSMGDLWKNPDGTPVAKNKVYLLVNGMFKPRMTIEAGQWYRLRIIFAAIEKTLTMRAASFEKMKIRNGFSCEFGLLAKDGVYLNVAPRVVTEVYLASGNRADVAMRCSCASSTSCRGSLFSMAHLMSEGDSYFETSDLKTQAASDRKTRFRNGHNDMTNTGPFANQTQMHQEMVQLNVVPPGTGKSVQADLKAFKVNKPCYLADLQEAEVPDEQQGIITFPNPGTPIPPAKEWMVVYWSNYTYPYNYHGSPMHHSETALPVHRFRSGEVWQLHFTGPDVCSNTGIALHPAHLHVTPYQIIKLRCTDGTWVGPSPGQACDGDNYFQTGDWHDTLLYSGGQAIVRLQTAKFTGRYVLHCHILSHEDMGMMTYFQVDGQEGAAWPGAANCYNDPAGAGYQYAGPL